MTTDAKQLFGTGQYQVAEESFLALAQNSTDPFDRSLQLSNASQCAINLSMYDRAAQHAREAIELNPRNFKAHYRSAAAYGHMRLPKNNIDAARRCCDIAMANARAFALLKANNPGKGLPKVVGIEIVSSHKHPLSARAADLLHLISDSKIILVTEMSDILLCSGMIAVLLPNSEVSIPPWAPPAHIVGLDESATIHAISEAHALLIDRNVCSAWSLRFKGASDAMLCTLGDLALIDCAITDHNENGILVAEPGGLALIAFCNVDNCVTGVEVREGASATIIRSNIRNMSKCGISAYGGARSLALEETLVENAAVEGVQCHGPRAPAVVNPLNSGQFRQESRKDTIAAAVADAAANAARTDVNSARLSAEFRNCCIRNCGSTSSSQVVTSGVTIDQNAHASLRGCLFTRCRMASVYIKGGCDVSIQYCRFNHGHSGDAGVRVDINYDGKVNIKHSVFVGKINAAVFEMSTAVRSHQRTMARVLTGAHSTPIHRDMIRVVPRPSNAPSIEQLRQDLENQDICEKDTRSLTGLTSSADAATPGGGGILYRTLGKQYVGIEYPIGNTYGRDVLHRVDTKNTRKGQAFVILAACGDIRNVVETICGLEKRRIKQATFLLNDISISILARNVALLELACQLWPKTKLVKRRQRAGRIWLHAWGSIALTEGDYSALHQVLTDLSEGKLPAWLSNLHSNVRNSLTSCWLEWASCKRSLREVREERDVIESCIAASKTPGVVHAALAAGLKETESCELLRNAELLSGGGMRINPTLLTSSLQYNMYESSIFRAMDMRNLIRGDISKLHWAACEIMNGKGPIVAKKLLSGSLTLEVEPGDLTFVLGSKHDADVVDLSNVQDYISKPACLISAARCLSRPGGILSSHTMMERTTDQNPLGFANLRDKCLLGANPEELEELLGIQPFKMEDASTCSYGNDINFQSRWVYRAREHGSRKTRDSSKLQASMMHLAAVWCEGPSAWRGFNIRDSLAAWPSAVAALKVVVAATESMELSSNEIVVEMCNASPTIAPFEMELKAHAAAMDGKESTLVLATLCLKGLEKQPAIGMQKQYLLQLGVNLGEDKEKTISLFDVFDCSFSRGVCEVIVRREDVSSMRLLDARLCCVKTGSNVLEGATESVTCLASDSTLRIRDLIHSETQALRRALSL